MDAQLAMESSPSRKMGMDNYIGPWWTLNFHLPWEEGLDWWGFKILLRGTKRQSLLEFVYYLFQFKFNFSTEDIFFSFIRISKIYLSVKWSFKSKAVLKLYETLILWCFTSSYYYWKKECPSISSFLYCLLKTIKLFNKYVICYFHYLKSILNGNSFKENIGPVVFIDSKYILW